MDNNKVKLLVYALLFAILFLGLIQTIMNYSRLTLRLELFGFILLIIATFIGFVGYDKHWGERVFFFVFLAYLANLVLLWGMKGDLYALLAVFALAGFVLSVPKEIAFSTKSGEAKQPHSVVFDQPKETKKEEKGKKATATFTPGKFIASSRSNVYHFPKCDWANKVAPSHRIWFKSKEEAWEKGYKGHECVS